MLTAVCMCSQFGVVVPPHSKETHVVAKAIVNHIFLKRGLCHEIFTDHGSEVEANCWGDQIVGNYLPHTFEV